jgi:hypothetical protein
MSTIHRSSTAISAFGVVLLLALSAPIAVRTADHPRTDAVRHGPRMQEY